MSSIKLAILITAALLTVPLTNAIHAEAPKSTNEKVSLKDRLVTGLRATRPEDIQYCERVANATRTGKLPTKIVDSTYFLGYCKKSGLPSPCFRKSS